MSEREQVQDFLRRGCTVRAAVVAKKLAEREPTDENISLLADVYFQQGLDDDAIALYLRIVKIKAGKSGKKACQSHWIN